MAALTAGWFTSRWFPDRWWQTGNQWFTEYGSAAAPVAWTPGGVDGPPIFKRRKPVDLMEDREFLRLLTEFVEGL